MLQVRCFNDVFFGMIHNVKDHYQVQRLVGLDFLRIHVPRTQMTLVLNGTGLFLWGSNPKIEDKQVPGIYIIYNIYNIYIYNIIYILHIFTQGPFWGNFTRYILIQTIQE